MADDENDEATEPLSWATREPEMTFAEFWGRLEELSELRSWPDPRKKLLKWKEQA